MSSLNLLSIEQGKDYINVDEARLPYVYKRVLGQGNSGWVEEVEDRLTNKVYARKKIPIVRYRQEERAKVFRNELSIIRGLESHHHIISVFATYVTPQNFGLILQPVASDGDLQLFLVAFWKIADDVAATGQQDARLDSMRLVLRRAFGCLAAGLAFMHEKKIRHKDVKPSNILVHKGAVIYTDFGYSFDFSGFNRSTTEGAPNFLTRRYSSPELSMHEPRNSKSDVFSLGCVFIEILSALTLDRALDATSSVGFSAALEFLHKQLSSIDAASCPSSLVEIVIRMTKRQPSQRVCSVHMAEVVLEVPAFCCTDCSRTPIGIWKQHVKDDGCHVELNEDVEEPE